MVLAFVIPSLKLKTNFHVILTQLVSQFHKKTWLGFISFDKNKFVSFSLVCPPGYCKDGVSV